MIYKLLFYYGLFLIVCGIVSVVFIGSKAKTALISGGTSGLLAILIGHLLFTGADYYAPLSGIGLSFALSIVFAWRSTKTLFKIFELLAVNPSGQTELHGKGIAFLIISLMAVVSMVVLILQLINY
jgi:hypothetical protein